MKSSDANQLIIESYLVLVLHWTWLIGQYRHSKHSIRPSANAVRILVHHQGCKFCSALKPWTVFSVQHYGVCPCCYSSEMCNDDDSQVFSSFLNKPNCLLQLQIKRYKNERWIRFTWNTETYTFRIAKEWTDYSWSNAWIKFSYLQWLEEIATFHFQWCSKHKQKIRVNN